MRKKKAAFPFLIAILITLWCPVSVHACELLYSGGDMTDDGANMFMRSEEIYADDNKTYYVSPAGNHVKGESYQGCTDFVWTFTHDSYKYTARCDGRIDGVCPTCESDHDHTPYEEAGTNDHGVTVSATQSLNANAIIKKADPFIDGGIEESEMATVLLSEAATAREGVKLLASIYDSVGGDEITTDGKVVYVNGDQITEPYIQADTHGTGQSNTWIVPKGTIFAMGDNRDVSVDSRLPEVGFIDEADILGKVAVRLFPFNQIGGVE